jgi:hypothetical protein
VSEDCADTLGRAIACPEFPPPAAAAIDQVATAATTATATTTARNRLRRISTVAGSEFETVVGVLLWSQCSHFHEG